MAYDKADQPKSMELQCDMDLRFIRYKCGTYFLDVYIEYLKRTLPLFPEGARAFAGSPWKYDTTHPQSFHDSWLKTLYVANDFSDSPSTRTIEARFLGPYHNRMFELRYEGVTRLSMTAGDQFQSARPADLQIDEIVLVNRGLVRHYLLFEDGKIEIICRDIHYQCTEIADRSDDDRHR